MTPGARVAATIELLDEIVSHSERPADLVANAYFRARRFYIDNPKVALPPPPQPLVVDAAEGVSL